MRMKSRSINRTTKLQIKTSKYANPFGKAVLEHISRYKPSIILDVGGGPRQMDFSGYVNLDIYKHEFVTIVGDAHYLPLRNNSIDFCVCQAVIEHLQKPWIASEEMYKVVKQGGYVYVDSAFLQTYHGYPHHYFNTTKQGLEILFQKFQKVRSGVQDYQMPSYAILMFLGDYLRLFMRRDEANEKGTSELGPSFMIRLINEFFRLFDRLIDRTRAEMVSAGVFFYGFKPTHLYNLECDLKSPEDHLG